MELGVARSTTILGVGGGSDSIFRGDCTRGRIDEMEGGGDFSRGGVGPSRGALMFDGLLDLCIFGDSTEKSGVAGECN